MKKIFGFLTLFGLLALLLVPTGAVHAQGPNPGGNGGRVIFGSNFTLESGESFNGDLVVFGGNVTIEENAEMNGALVVFGGTAESNGEVNGDVVIIGGQAKLDEKAHVTGDVVTVGGQLQKAEGAQVDGEIVNNIQPRIQIPNGRVPPISVPDIPAPVVDVGFNPFLEFGKTMSFSILIALLGMLASLFFQNRLGKISQAVVAQPLMVGAIGLLSVFAALMLFFTVIPLFALAFAWLFGVIAIGQEIGERFAKSLRQEWTPAVATGLGTFALIFVVSSIQAAGHVAWFVSCVTWIVPALVGLLAIGAVVITRVGARQIQSPVMAAYTPPAASGQAPPASEP